MHPRDFHSDKPFYATSTMRFGGKDYVAGDEVAWRGVVGEDTMRVLYSSFQVDHVRPVNAAPLAPPAKKPKAAETAKG